MAKKLVFETVSLGSEPQIPDAGTLAEWVGSQRGKKGDIISYYLENGLKPQRDAGVIHHCAGGICYGDRVRESLLGVSEGEITGELGILPDYFIDDCVRIREISGMCRVALPAPHQISLADRYYHDQEELSAALISQYRRIFRTMRDCRISGNVLHCIQAIPEELESLAGKHVFFHMESPGVESMGTILEYQHALALKPEDIPKLSKVREEYTIDRVIILDPVARDLRGLLNSFDSDRVQVGGYWTTGDGEYWESLVESATLPL